MYKHIWKRKEKYVPPAGIEIQISAREAKTLPLRHGEKQILGKKILLHIRQGIRDTKGTRYWSSVMRVGSDTFGDPIFQKGLQN